MEKSKRVLAGIGCDLPQVAMAGCFSPSSSATMRR
jgi:hypothetical protein